MRSITWMGLLGLGLGCGGLMDEMLELPSEPMPEDVTDPVDLSAPEGDPVDISLADNDVMVWRGGESETIVLQYSDWRCPHCLTAYPIVREAVEKAGAEMRFRNFPLSGPCNPMVSAVREDRCELAIASLCVVRTDGFDAFVEQVIAAPDGLVARLAEEDPSFAACMKEPQMMEWVQGQANTGADLGIQGTPVFFVRRDGVWHQASGTDQVVAWLR